MTVMCRICKEREADFSPPGGYEFLIQLGIPLVIRHSFLSSEGEPVALCPIHRAWALIQLLLRYFELAGLAPES